MSVRRVDPDSVNRVVKLLVDSDPTLTFETAEELLRTYRLQITIGADACADPAWQAALLTAVNAGIRAVLGGVRVVLAQDVPCMLPWARGQQLSVALGDLGAQVIPAGGGLEVGVPTIAFGAVKSSAAAGMIPRAPLVHPSLGTSFQRSRMPGVMVNG